MALKVPEPIAINRSAYDGPFIAQWKDDATRYHVWLDADGRIPNDGDTIIYKNGPQSHRTIKLKLAHHPKIEAAIRAAATPDALDEATAKANEREANRIAASHAAAIENLRDDAARLGFKIVPIEAGDAS